MQAVTTKKSMRGGESRSDRRLGHRGSGVPLYRRQDDRAGLRFSHGARRRRAARRASTRSSSATRDDRPRRRRSKSTASPTTISARSSSAPLAALFWGVAGMAVGVYIAFELAYPWLNIAPWFNFGRLRPLHTSAVIFAFGGNVLLGDLVLCRAAHLPRAAGRRSGAVVRRARLQLLHRHRRHGLPARHHRRQGIRRAGMVCRPLADDRLGRPISWCSSARCARARSPTSIVANWFYLAFIVTIAMLHLGNNAAMPISLFSSKSVHPVGRRAGRDVPVVVRPQRGRLLPHRRLPGHHVLLRAEAGGAADLFLPAVDHPLLGADLPLHLGGPAPSALHRAAGLGADAGHDLLDHAVDALVGRHDQRPADACRALGTSCAPIRSCACWWCRSPSTACRPSKVR